jgi:RNA polymerase sigma-70 factor (ECF subfamily)
LEWLVVSAEGGTGAVGFEAFYRAQHPRLVALLTVALGDVEAAGEACSEAFVRALERWERVSEFAEPVGWVYRVALNVGRRQARRRTIERRLLARLAPPETVEPVEPIDPALWRALGKLTFRQRSVVALRHVAGLSQNEVAAVLGIRPGTVSATLVVARRRLIEELTAADDLDPEVRHA